MRMNEADTRYHLIDPLLREKGYVSCERITLETVLTPAPVEPIGPKGRRPQGAWPHGLPALCTSHVPPPSRGNRSPRRPSVCFNLSRSPDFWYKSLRSGPSGTLLAAILNDSEER